MADVAPSSLSSLTTKQKYKAFEKIRDKTNIQDGTLVLISEPLYDAVIDFMIENLVPYEPVSKALQFDTLPDDWKQNMLNTLNFNLSAAVISNDGGDIMAVFLVSIEKADIKITPDTYNDTRFKTMMTFFRYCDDHANFYTHFGTTEAFHFEEGAVSEKHRNRKLGSKVFVALLNFFKNLGISPVHVKIECTPNFLKSFVEKQGFEILYEQMYSEYTVDGEVVIKNTGEHKSMIVYGKRI